MEPTQSQGSSSPESGDFDLFWWPGVEALDDLLVEYNEEGYLLSAPNGTLCSDWLAYWSETPERIEIFSREYTKALFNLEQHGESINEQQQDDSSDPEKVCAGAQQTN